MVLGRRGRLILSADIAASTMIGPQDECQRRESSARRQRAALLDSREWGRDYKIRRGG